jgi:hypothetical protein
VDVHDVGKCNSCTRRSKIYLHLDKGTQSSSLTVKKPSEWPITEQTDPRTRVPAPSSSSYWW